MLTHIHTKKTQIMRAALQLVAEEGVARTTTARISELACVAEGTIYRHFASKDDLLIAVYRQIKDEVFEFVSAKYDLEASLQDRFHHLWQQTFLAYREDYQCLAFAQKFGETELMKTEGGIAHQPMAKLLYQLHEDGVAQSMFKTLSPDLLIALFYAPIVALLRAEAGDKSWPETEITAARLATFDAWVLHTPE